jgi:hypothetical protein
MARELTVGEIKFLEPIFGRTLHYYAIHCDINKHQLGGPDNSITLSGNPLFAQQVYEEDFSKADINSQWIFVHEVTHAWQWQHGRYPVWEGLGLAMRHGAKHYDKSYPYDLNGGKNFDDYNLEQQASIMADYWIVSRCGKSPRHNNNKDAKESDYSEIISQFRRSGVPSGHTSDPFGSSDGTSFQ